MREMSGGNNKKLSQIMHPPCASKEHCNCKKRVLDIWAARWRRVRATNAEWRSFCRGAAGVQNDRAFDGDAWYRINKGNAEKKMARTLYIDSARESTRVRGDVPHRDARDSPTVCMLNCSTMTNPRSKLNCSHFNQSRFFQQMN